MTTETSELNLWVASLLKLIEQPQYPSFRDDSWQIRVVAFEFNPKLQESPLLTGTVLNSLRNGLTDAGFWEAADWWARASKLDLAFGSYTSAEATFTKGQISQAAGIHNDSRNSVARNFRLKPSKGSEESEAELKRRLEADVKADYLASLFWGNGTNFARNLAKYDPAEREIGEIGELDELFSSPFTQRGTFNLNTKWMWHFAYLRIVLPALIASHNWTRVHELASAAVESNAAKSTVAPHVNKIAIEALAATSFGFEDVADALVQQLAGNAMSLATALQIAVVLRKRGMDSTEAIQRVDELAQDLVPLGKTMAAVEPESVVQPDSLPLSYLRLLDSGTIEIPEVTREMLAETEALKVGGSLNEAEAYAEALWVNYPDELHRLEALLSECKNPSDVIAAAISVRVNSGDARYLADPVFTSMAEASGVSLKV